MLSAVAKTHLVGFSPDSTIPIALHQQQRLHEDDCDAGCVAEEGHQGDIFQVPGEVYLLQAHGYHASCRTDDEDAATHTGTVGEEQPEEAVGGRYAPMSMMARAVSFIFGI